VNASTHLLSLGQTGRFVTSKLFIMALLHVLVTGADVTSGDRPRATMNVFKELKLPITYR